MSSALSTPLEFNNTRRSIKLQCCNCGSIAPDDDIDKECPICREYDLRWTLRAASGKSRHIPGAELSNLINSEQLLDKMAARYPEGTRDLPLDTGAAQKVLERNIEKEREREKLEREAREREKRKLELELEREEWEREREREERERKKRERKKRERELEREERERKKREREREKERERIRRIENIKKITSSIAKNVKKLLIFVAELIPLLIVIIVKFCTALYYSIQAAVGLALICLLLFISFGGVWFIIYLISLVL